MKMVKLPQWDKPETLAKAASIIESLEHTTQQAAYCVGKCLAWVKSELGSKAAFEAWLETKVKHFGRATAWKRIAYASRCDTARELLENLDDASPDSGLISDEPDKDVAELVTPQLLNEAAPREPKNEPDEKRPRSIGEPDASCIMEEWLTTKESLTDLVESTIQCNNLSESNREEVSRLAEQIAKQAERMVRR